VPNGAPKSVHRPEESYSGRQTSAGCGRAERRDFLPATFCGRSRADLLLERQSAALLPSCVRPKRMCSDGRERLPVRDGVREAPDKKMKTTMTTTKSNL
jgi:hypothetical protein